MRVSEPIWKVLEAEDHCYVPRCSFCGHYKKELRKHWFFTGIYCLACIQDVLYDNCRTITEVDRGKRSCVIHNKEEIL